MLLIAPETTSAAVAEARGHHWKQLLAALGDGSEWHYTGDCFEDSSCNGTCACGHMGLRFLFKIERARDGRTTVVGSKCIEHFQSVNPRMVAAIGAAVDQLKQAAADRLKQAKALAAEKVIADELAKATDLAYRLDSILATGAESFQHKSYQFNRAGEMLTSYRQVRRVARVIWDCWHTPDIAARRLAERTDGPYPFRFKAYKSRSAFLKAVRSQIELLESLLNGPIWEQRNHWG